MTKKIPTVHGDRNKVSVLISFFWIYNVQMLLEVITGRKSMYEVSTYCCRSNLFYTLSWKCGVPSWSVSLCRTPYRSSLHSPLPPVSAYPWWRAGSSPPWTKPDTRLESSGLTRLEVCSSSAWASTIGYWWHNELVWKYRSKSHPTKRIFLHSGFKRLSYSD